MNIISAKERLLPQHPFPSYTERQGNVNTVSIQMGPPVFECRPTAAVVDLQIFSFLSPQDLCVAARVNKKWKDFSSDDRIWRPHIKSLGTVPSNITPKAQYVQLELSRRCEEEVKQRQEILILRDRNLTRKQWMWISYIVATDIAASVLIISSLYERRETPSQYNETSISYKNRILLAKTTPLLFSTAYNSLMNFAAESYPWRPPCHQCFSRYTTLLPVIISIGTLIVDSPYTSIPASIVLMNSSVTSLRMFAHTETGKRKLKAVKKTCNSRIIPAVKACFNWIRSWCGSLPSAEN